jgi:hypothetical protein
MIGERRGRHMGFWDWVFGWGKREEDQPEPRVLAALPASPAPEVVAVAAAPSMRPQKAEKVVSSPVAAPAPAPPAPPGFGIETAIALMRTLPLDDDADLVLRVVRKTLRSTGVSVEDVVGSANKREADLAESIAQQRAAIEDLERQIVTRKGEVERTVTQLVETRSVRQRLQEAIQNESKVGPLVSPAELARLQAEAAAPKPPPPASAVVVAAKTEQAAKIEKTDKTESAPALEAASVPAAPASDPSPPKNPSPPTAKSWRPPLTKPPVPKKSVAPKLPTAARPKAATPEDDPPKDR